MPKKTIDDSFPERIKIELFEVVVPMLSSTLQQFEELSKRKADGAVNKFKLGAVNELIKQIIEVLEKEPELKLIKLFTDDDVPTNSDVALVLSQYKTALVSFRGKYCFSDAMGLSSRWHTLEDQ